MALRHPLESIPAHRRRRVFLPLLAATLVVMAVLNLMDTPLRTDAAPRGILSFEFAGTPTQAQRILESWNPSARSHAAFSLGLDYLFLVLYSTTIALACVWSGGILRESRSDLAAWSGALAWAQWGAALLDAVENAALLRLLLGGGAPPWAALAWGCAALKFALVVAGLAYAALGAARASGRRRVALG